MKKIWKIKPPSPRAETLSRETGLSLLMTQLLIGRGISESPHAQTFLSPRLAHLVSPLELKDMDKAVELILRSIESGQKITIYGDFDADGLTATALLLNFFSSLGVPTSYYVPNRLTEGYGLNPEAVIKIAKDGTQMIITVDCGISDAKEIALATTLGVKTIVTDHHQVPENFDPLCPVINPHRPDSSFPFKHLAGVGLAFFLAAGVRAALRERGWFRSRPEPDLKKCLDLVALGTVADMVPLQDQNRVLVSAGIERMRNSLSPGLHAIAEMASVVLSKITPYDIAFKMAPRLNASGRLGSAEMCVVTLTTTQPQVAQKLAGQLETMNTQRQSIERDIFQCIEDEISSKGIPEDRRTLIFWGKDWHRGVLGIVASRLLEKYHRPVMVLSIQDGIASGSGRSIAGFNLYQALCGLRSHLRRFGGHEHAAGLALDVSHLQEFSGAIERLAQNHLTPEDLIGTLEVDGETTLQEMDLETVRRLEALAPFGPGNPEPLLCARNVRILESRVVGDKHLKAKVKQNGAVAEAIGFRLWESHPLQGKTVDMVFTPQIDRWQGRERVQLKMIDLEPRDGPSNLNQA
jgi:single-stranded-DNA-specific exonuclease